jgi:DNA-binding transcriptional regulator YiaG
LTALELRELLGRLDLTQAAAAALIGVDVRSMRRWVCAEAPAMEPATRLLSLIDALGLKPARVARLLDLPVTTLVLERLEKRRRHG